jgi:hypothetical protein
MEKPPIHDVDFQGLANVALEISRKRRDTLASLQVALQRGDEAEALRLAKQLCGFTHEQESN